MDFFDRFSLVLGAAFLVSGFFRRKIGDLRKFRKAVAFFITALILYYPVPELFAVGMYLGFVTRPMGFVLIVLGFRLLCLGLIFHSDDANGAPD